MSTSASSLPVDYITDSTFSVAMKKHCSHLYHTPDNNRTMYKWIKDNGIPIHAK